MTVICTVAPGSVDATVDGRTIMHWTGQSNHLSLDPELAADVGNSLALVASSWFHIQRAELVPLSGTARSGRCLCGAGDGAQDPWPGVSRRAGPAGTMDSASAASTGLAVVPSPEARKCVALIEHPLGSGSGFAVGKKLVATNAHVVEGVFADEIKVRFGRRKAASRNGPRGSCILIGRGIRPYSSCRPSRPGCRSAAIMRSLPATA